MWWKYGESIIDTGFNGTDFIGTDFIGTDFNGTGFNGTGFNGTDFNNGGWLCITLNDKGLLCVCVARIEIRTVVNNRNDIIYEINNILSLYYTDRKEKWDKILLKK